MTKKLLHLQGMRGVAICSVVLFHYFPERFPNGYLGVDLFFVLSGYLMSMMLTRHEYLSLGTTVEFLYRRLKRIAPLYYFVIFVTTGSLWFLPFTNIAPNISSSWNAIFLSTNIIKSGDMDYFQKLGLTRDFFTHTWSLCLEMQFYALFPFVWILQTRFSDFSRICVLYAISAASIAYYSLSDEFSTFNSVVSRIWQFLLGNVVFILEERENKVKKNGYTLLHEEEKRDSGISAEWVTTSFALTLLVFTYVSSDNISQNYARFTVTIISSILILFGRQFFLLECKPMVFLGEISYSWYLVHWPLVSTQKLLSLDSDNEMIYGVGSSLFTAIFVHYLFEKRYLIWEKTVIILTVFILIGLTIGTLILLNDYITASSQRALIKPIHIMTKDEIIRLNIEMDNHDQLQLRMRNCTYIPEQNTWHGHCEYEKFNSKRNNTIMIVGNSWAANQASIVFEECFGNAGRLVAQVKPSCEVLFNTTSYTWCKNQYMEDIERIRPNQLFIIARAVQFGERRSGMEMINVVTSASQKLQSLEELVSDKIFILDVFPSFTQHIVSIINTAIDTGITPNYNEIHENQEGTAAARAAMKDIVRNCSKCELFDYVPYFSVNGTVYPYDVANFVSFFTGGKHLTPAGLERIRPLYKELCSRI